MKKAKIIWLTGLSGSGKTTIANMLCDKLSDKLRIRIIDGDDVRSTMNKHLGFTPEDIKENNRLIVELCLKEQDKYDLILVPVIAPFEESRHYARRSLGDDLIEVYVKASLEEVKKRDVKGLYKKALNGEIESFIGIAPNVPYEIPQGPDLVLDTETLSTYECIDILMEYLIAERVVGSG